MQTPVIFTLSKHFIFYIGCQIFYLKKEFS